MENWMKIPIFIFIGVLLIYSWLYLGLHIALGWEITIVWFTIVVSGVAYAVKHPEKFDL